MPNPKNYKPSEKSKYMRDCMHQTMHVERKDRDKSLAQCLNVWRKHHPSDKYKVKKSVEKVIKTYFNRQAKEVTEDENVELSSRSIPKEKIMDYTYYAQNNIWNNIIKNAMDYFEIHFDRENDSCQEKRILTFTDVEKLESNDKRNEPIKNEYKFAVEHYHAGGDWEDPNSYFRCQLLKGSIWGNSNEKKNSDKSREDLTSDIMNMVRAGNKETQNKLQKILTEELHKQGGSGIVPTGWNTEGAYDILEGMGNDELIKILDMFLPDPIQLPYPGKLSTYGIKNELPYFALIPPKNEGNGNLTPTKNGKGWCATQNNKNWKEDLDDKKAWKWVISYLEKYLEINRANRLHMIITENGKIEPCKADRKLTADYPKHPDTVVIGPSGELSKKDKVEGHQPKKFTEKDVWSFYDGIKTDILKDIKGKDLFIRLKTDTGFIYVRHPFGGNSEFIRIDNDKDFDKYNNGRTVEFHTTMPAMCSFYVVDFDAVGDWNKTKKITGEIADGLDKLPEVKKVEIRYTGKRGFHILGWLKRAVPIDKAREDLKEWLRTAFKDRDDLVVGESPSGSKGALGVSPMKLNGGQVALWSLRVTGLCCVEVPRAGLGSFKREDASLEKTYKKLTGKTFTPTEQKEATNRIVESFMARKQLKIAGEVSTPTFALLTWKEISDHYAKKYGNEHHCVRYICTKCGNQVVCKCMWDKMKYPLVEEHGLCDACCKPQTYECKACHKTNAYYKEFGSDCDGGQDEILLYCPDCHTEN